MKAKQQDPNHIVKCGCGLPMRQKDWAGHWNGCRVGGSVEVTEQDREALLAYEERRRRQDEEHKAWLAARMPGTIGFKQGTLAVGGA